jgi:hypothetical protein
LQPVRMPAAHSCHLRVLLTQLTLCYDTLMLKNKLPKHRKGAWFVSVRGSYLPISWQGWLTYLPFLAYLGFSVVAAVDYTGNDVKAILWIVPNWVAAAVVMTWIAKVTS